LEHFHKLVGVLSHIDNNNKMSIVLVTTILGLATLFYIGVELLFFFIFHFYFIPRANKLVPPAPYRDYGKKRSELIVRILQRIEATCTLTNKDLRTSIHSFFAECFHHASTNPSSDRRERLDVAISTEASEVPLLSAENVDSEPSGCLYKEEMDDFFAWALFGKQYSTLLPWESEELRKTFTLLQEKYKIQFPQKCISPQEGRPETFDKKQPRCMSLEPVNSIHRPLLIYIIVALLKTAAGLLLRLLGYRRIVSSTGLVGWYKASKQVQHEGSSFLPLLFFHGIAPGGLVFYLPMILLGIATERDRPIFLFENPSISCTIDFNVLTEEQTVQGVEEIIDQCLGSERVISVMGHSFGSISIAWLLKSKLASQIQQIALLDPVAILLSEADVMINFLYSGVVNIIHVAVATELFTEYYLRRHVAWYNSELWLDDLQEHHKMLVCLSEQDEVINVNKVKQELERNALDTSRKNKPTTIYWGDVRHAGCMASPTKWKQIKNILIQQELDIVRHSKPSSYSPILETTNAEVS